MLSCCLLMSSKSREFLMQESTNFELASLQCEMSSMLHSRIDLAADYIFNIILINSKKDWFNPKLNSLFSVLTFINCIKSIIAAKFNNFGKYFFCKFESGGKQDFSASTACGPWCNIVC